MVVAERVPSRGRAGIGTLDNAAGKQPTAASVAEISHQHAFATANRAATDRVGCAYATVPMLRRHSGPGSRALSSSTRRRRWHNSAVNPKEKIMLASRRQFLLSLTALAVAPVVRTVYADSPALAALAKSQLVYLTPILADGRESACHGEVWFVQHAGDLFVSSQTTTWRARAVAQGLTRAKIWIGEFGVWSKAEERFRSAPFLEIEGRAEADAAVQGEVLKLFGAKYAAEWGTWGPRFHAGLADGSRVLLRYRVVS
jgi:hypothetical protein